MQLRREKGGHVGGDWPLRGPRPALQKRAVGPPNGGTTGTGINAASTTPAEKGAAEPMIPQNNRDCPSVSCKGRETPQEEVATCEYGELQNVRSVAITPVWG